MRFHNGTADRQSHSGSVGLGGKEWFEDTVRVLWIESCSRILDLDQHTVGVHCRLDEQFPWSIRDHTHGFDAIHNQVDQDLLSLHAVGTHARKITAEISPQRYTAPNQLTAQEHSQLLNNLINVHRNSLGCALLQKRADS